MGDASSWLPPLNAGLNSIAAVLLVVGRVAIRRGQRERHKWLMLSAFLVSALFLVSYLIYHFAVVPEVGHTPFRGEGGWKIAYYVLLISHVILAAVNLPMILVTLGLAARGRFERHRVWARVTWPVWFYVSVTGVLVYLALYHFQPNA